MILWDTHDIELQSGVTLEVRIQAKRAALLGPPDHEVRHRCGNPVKGSNGPRLRPARRNPRFDYLFRRLPVFMRRRPMTSSALLRGSQSGSF